MTPGINRAITCNDTWWQNHETVVNVGDALGSACFPSERGQVVVLMPLQKDGPYRYRAEVKADPTKGAVITSVWNPFGGQLVHVMNGWESKAPSGAGPHHDDFDGQTVVGTWAFQAVRDLKGNTDLKGTPEEGFPGIGDLMLASPYIVIEWKAPR